MHTSKFTKCLTSTVIFQYHLDRWCKLQIHTIDRLSDLGVGIHTDDKQDGLHRKLKMTHVDFSILNNHVTVAYLRFMKSTNFYVIKKKNFK